MRTFTCRKSRNSDGKDGHFLLNLGNQTLLTNFNSNYGRRPARKLKQNRVRAELAGCVERPSKAKAWGRMICIELQTLLNGSTAPLRIKAERNGPAENVDGSVESQERLEAYPKSSNLISPLCSMTERSKAPLCHPCSVVPQCLRHRGAVRRPAQDDLSSIGAVTSCRRTYLLQNRVGCILDQFQNLAVAVPSSQCLDLYLMVISNIIRDLHIIG